MVTRYQVLTVLWSELDMFIDPKYSVLGAISEDLFREHAIQSTHSFWYEFP